MPSREDPGVKGLISLYEIKVPLFRQPEWDGGLCQYWVWMANGSIPTGRYRFANMPLNEDSSRKSFWVLVVCATGRHREWWGACLSPNPLPAGSGVIR